jgi:hypothetical protein
VGAVLAVVTVVIATAILIGYVVLRDSNQVMGGGLKHHHR